MHPLRHEQTFNLEHSRDKSDSDARQAGRSWLDNLRVPNNAADGLESSRRRATWVKNNFFPHLSALRLASAGYNFFAHVDDLFRINDCRSTRFVYDGANMVLEINANNEVIWAWVNAPGLDQPVERIVLGRFCSMEKFE